MLAGSNNSQSYENWNKLNFYLSFHSHPIFIEFLPAKQHGVETGEQSEHAGEHGKLRACDTKVDGEVKDDHFFVILFPCNYLQKSYRSVFL